ncbi:OmpP1/FadL family transporter [Agarivorans gilvus]|uniref:Aromatic hydrocarbon degradation protein n=1 Tax=Agarivorans gilvus TaxID=680279 RepID=A0ABQ1I2K8_9ALTE|nr:outer membrane protein transport protein [Agarivorans gilvus]GGB06395.1 aromatic hydrocarbon degradation protein [Agarivorans gilvus]
MKKRIFSLTALSATLLSGHSLAAGFQVNSQSATGIGRAFSGDAVIADNASVLARNPAAMAMFEQKALSLGLVYTDVDVTIKDVNYGPVEYGSVGDAAGDKVIPNIYYIHPINNDFAVGVGAFSNFGTGTDISELNNSGAPVTPVDLFGNTEVITSTFNMSMSYRINQQFSIGAGVDLIYGQGTLRRQGEIVGGSGVQSKLVDVDADGWALGGIIGATYEINDNNRLGMSYRVSPSFKAAGKVEYQGQSYDDIHIPLPNIFQIAGYHELNHKWAVHYTAQHTSWSDFDHITVTGSLPEQTVKSYQWKNSWLFSVGATYQLNPNWALRAGYMHDKGVVDEVSSLSIPDSDRNWYTVGASYYINKHSSIDFGLGFVRGEDVEVRESSAIPVIGEVVGHTRSDAIYYSMQYSYLF